MPELTERERDLVARARRKAFILYQGRQVAHRSCGIAIAETWGLPTRPYQSLRRGGITGEGECGAMKAGELVLGELLGDPDPTGPVTDALRAAAAWYQVEVRRRLAEARLIPGGPAPDIICNHLTRPHRDFDGEARMAACSNIAAVVAEVTAEALLRQGAVFEIGPIPEK